MTVTRLITRFVRDDRGAAGVEYGLLVALIAAVIVLSVQALGVTLNGAFVAVNNALAPAA